MSIAGEIYIASGTSDRFWYFFLNNQNMWLRGMPISGYSSEPDGSLFVRASSPGLVYKKAGQSYLLVGVPMGATSEPNGSLWVSSSDQTLRFALNGQMYQVNRHLVRNITTADSGAAPIEISGLQAGTSWFYFTGITPGQTLSNPVGFLNGFISGPITSVMTQWGPVGVSYFTPPYSGGVIVVGGHARYDWEVGATYAENISISWSAT